MTSRTRNRRVSYKEVDSASEGENDDIEEGENDETMSTTKASGSKARGRGDTYGTAKPPKKKARRSTTKSKNFNKDDSAAPEVPSYNADLLLDLPFDMLAEVCSHLDAVDLISLAKVSKQFRKLFLSPSTRSVWTTLRRRDGYELPGGMDDVAFALFMFGTHCQDCGGENTDKNYEHRVRLCGTCTGKRYVTRSTFRPDLKDLHSQAFYCVQGGSRGLYVAAELNSVNEKLQDLEDEDEQTRSDNQKITLWTTKSRRRSSAPSGEVKPANAVDLFVEQRQAEIAQTNEDMNAVCRRQEELQELAADAEIEAYERNEADELKASYDWTDEQIAYLQSWRIHRLRQLKPLRSPEEDVKGWRKYRNAIQARLDVEEAERQAQIDRNARLVVLRDVFDEAVEEMGYDLNNILPQFSEFQNMPEIKPLWFPADAQLDQNNARDIESACGDALELYTKRLRIEAIRQILAAQTGSAATTSTDPADYPSDKYGERFFDRATSSFIVPPLRYGPFLHRTLTDTAQPYPVCLNYTNNMTLPNAYLLRRSISYKQVCAVRLCIEAAGLDEDSATIDDMDMLGKAFRWPTCPRKSSRAALLNWVDMVQLIEKRGPGVLKLKAGETVELDFVRRKEPKKGTTKIRLRRLGSESDLDSDEEDVKPVIDSDEEDVKPVLSRSDEEEEEEDEEDA